MQQLKKKKEIIQHEEVVTSTCYEIRENKLTANGGFIFTFAAVVIECDYTPNLNAGKEMS